MVGLVNNKQKKRKNVAQVGAVSSETVEMDDGDVQGKGYAVIGDLGEAAVKKPKTWDLSHLEGRQLEMMESVLKEVDEVFSKSDSDIGTIPDFQMPIHLVDNVPVTEAYRRIPPHLYQELRNYIEDLCSNGWVRESFYSIAMLC